MYKVGIIGTGRIAFLLENDPLRLKPCTHFGGIKKNKKLKIIAVCDIDPARLSAFSMIYPVKNLYSNYKEMFKKHTFDVIVISTWTDTHKEITLAAAKNMTKVIICEKPMSFKSQDCQRMITICKKYNCHLIINHERRWDPLYLKAKELIQSNKLGKIKTVMANVLTQTGFNKKSFLINKSSLLHDGTHLIDIALFLFGDIKKVTGLKPSYRKDTIYGIIEFKNGICLLLEAGGEREYFNFELDIQGTKGRLKIGNEYQKLWLKKRSPRYLGFFELEKASFPKLPKKNHFIEEYHEVVQILERKKHRPSSTGEDGMKVLKIIEQLTKK